MRTAPAPSSTVARVHERLIRHSDNAKYSGHRAGEARQDAQTGVEAGFAAAKRAVFLSMHLASDPPAGTGKLWIIERTIMFLQVCCVFAPKRGRKLANAVTVVVQLLAFPLSDAHALLWQQTLLASFTRFLSFVSLRSLEDASLETGMCFVAICVAVLAVVAIGGAAYAEASDSAIPRWMVQVTHEWLRLSFLCAW